MDAAPAVDHNRCWGSIAETCMCVKNRWWESMMIQIQILLYLFTLETYVAADMLRCVQSVCVCTVLTSPSATWWLEMDPPLLYREAQCPSSKGWSLSGWMSEFELELQKHPHTQTYFISPQMRCRKLSLTPTPSVLWCLSPSEGHRGGGTSINWMGIPLLGGLAPDTMWFIIIGNWSISSHEESYLYPPTPPPRVVLQRDNRDLLF